MIRLGLDGDGPLQVLALGAHADDIEIGCGGLLLELLAKERPVAVDWCVLSASPERAREARASAAAFLEGADQAHVDIQGFDDGHFPYQGGQIKRWFETLKARPTPNLVLTHTRDDRHQDHREVSNLTWNTFRNHLVLEYEIPKYDGDLGRPNLYWPLAETTLARKIELLHRFFPTQAQKPWFTADTFEGLARLRGIECNSPTGKAEAFTARKLTLG